MSFGDLLGQIMQQGLGAGSPTRGRLEAAGQNLDQPAGGLGGLFEQLQGALGGALGAGGAGGGFADRAQDFLRQDQVGGLSGAQVGGIGALAGALLGGGLGGAAKGGAMAVLGTLALSALKRAQGGGTAEQVQATPDELRAISSPDTERLLLRAMISAAKADGQIDQAEMQKVVGELAKDSVTAEEKQFVLDQMAGAVDVEALAAEVRSPAQAAEVYAASLMAINADTEAERAYLASLARALRLDDAAVAELHRLTGAPATA